ncbi:MAG TPA: hypothetical protein VN643_19150, partial [Pyrinomonadaceae bacterium]|nr:hypothetical protein [Pyrinomonadaceae bacterium]
AQASEIKWPLSHSRDQSQKESRTSSISKSFHEDEITNNAYFFRSLLGYLVVLVPLSERAPHMVIVKSEKRFYGRGETGNYVLSQAEVERLYDRRRRTETSIVPLLEDAIQQAPVADNERFAHLHIVARPVHADDALLDDALAPGQNHKDLLTNVLDQVESSGICRNGYVPDIGYPGGGWIRKPDGYMGKCHHGPEEDMGVQFQFNLDGSGYFFSGRAAEGRGDSNPKSFFSSIVAGSTTKFLAVLGELYDRSSYYGMVDVGLAVTGLHGCVPASPRDPFRELPKFSGSEYRKTARSTAILVKEDPRRLGAQLIMPLVDAISQGTDDPFRER